jgi:hypothetical protein
MAMAMQRKANVSFLSIQLDRQGMNLNFFWLWFQIRLPPEVNRVLYIRNLPYKITADEMYDIFGKYGAIRQIRVGITPETKSVFCLLY